MANASPVKADDSAQTPAVNDAFAQGQPSKLKPDALLRVLKQWWSVDSPHAKKWRGGDMMTLGAKDAFNFVSGYGQWTEGEIQQLDAQKRVPITFNRTLPTVSSVCGIEINSRHEIVYLPQTSTVLDDHGRMVVKLNEELTEASKAMADECDAEDHESEAFRDAVVTGMGWTEARVDYDVDPKGMYTERVINPLEMAWDYRSREKNLADSQRRWHLRCMALHEAKALFPKADPEDLNAEWATEMGAGKDRLDENNQSQDRELDERMYDPHAEVHVLRCQWWEYEAIQLVADPMRPDDVVPMGDEEYKKLQTAAELAGVTVQAVRGKRKVYKEAYIGAVVLGEVKTPQSKEGFSFNCITGIPDRNRGYWFGLCAVMRDPQKWANAWLSQTKYILDSTAKGGIIAETDAFTDINQATNSYAQPNAITWAAPGAIRNGKIMAKPGAGISAGHANLLEFAISSIRDVTGINLEILGLRDANQPGVLEAQRKQAAMTILAPWFDSLRRFRKQVGRVRMVYIQEFLSGPGRHYKKTNEDGSYTLIPLIKKNIIGPHEIIVSDAPASPNQKQETWGILQSIMPFFKDMMTPEVAMVCLEHSPLPSKVVDAFKGLLNKPPDPMAQAQKMLGMKGAAAEVAKTESEVRATDANAVRDRIGAFVDLITAGVAAQQAKQDALTGQAEREKMITEALMAKRGATGKLIEGDAPAIAPVENPGPMLPPQMQSPPQMSPELPMLPEMMPTDGAMQ